MDSLRNTLGAALTALALLAPAPGTASTAEEEAEAVVTPAQLRERWGIEVQGIRRSSAGYMLDFRYKVVDAEKAAGLINRQLKPQLIDRARDIRLLTPVPPKVGALRQTAARLENGRTYFILFANPGRLLGAGDPVAVAMGDVTLGGLEVQ